MIFDLKDVENFIVDCEKEAAFKKTIGYIVNDLLLNLEKKLKEDHNIDSVKFDVTNIAKSDLDKVIIDLKSRGFKVKITSPNCDIYEIEKTYIKLSGW